MGGFPCIYQIGLKKYTYYSHILTIEIRVLHVYTNIQHARWESWQNSRASPKLGLKNTNAVHI